MASSRTLEYLFLENLKQILANKTNSSSLFNQSGIDKIVRHFELIKSDNKPISLFDAKKLNIFKEDGSLNDDEYSAHKITFSNEINLNDYENLKGLNHKSRIYFYTIIETTLLLLEKHLGISEKKEELKKLREAAINAISSLGRLPHFSDADSLIACISNRQHELEIYNFEETNIYISPGPSVELLPLELFLKNLKREDIKQIFAVGRVFPYRQRFVTDGIPQDFILTDFINYFAPNKEGKVIIPSNLPYEITSTPIKKVGKITTYQVTISNSSTNEQQEIKVHHYPLHDGQPLELTNNELKYISTIQKESKDENMLTHCHGGLGRSAQIAYFLAARHKKFSQFDADTQLGLMRLERTGHWRSTDFIQNNDQVKDAIKNKNKINNELKETKLVPQSGAFLEGYFQVDLLFRKELERLRDNTKDITNAPYFEFANLYEQLNNKTNLSDVYDLLRKAQALPFVSDEFKNVPSAFSPVSIKPAEGMLALELINYIKLRAKEAKISIPENILLSLEDFNKLSIEANKIKLNQLIDFFNSNNKLQHKFTIFSKNNAKAKLLGAAKYVQSIVTGAGACNVELKPEENKALFKDSFSRLNDIMMEYQDVWKPETQQPLPKVTA